MGRFARKKRGPARSLRASCYKRRLTVLAQGFRDMRFAQDERRALVIGCRAGRARLFGAAFICALAPLVGCDKTHVAGANPSSGVPATITVVTAAARREPMGI